MEVEDEGISEVSNRMEHHNEAGSASQQRLFLPPSPAHSQNFEFMKKSYLGVQSEIVAVRKNGENLMNNERYSKFSSPDKIVIPR
jgi:hypothetical protein